MESTTERRRARTKCRWRRGKDEKNRLHLKGITKDSTRSSSLEGCRQRSIYLMVRYWNTHTFNENLNFYILTSHRRYINYNCIPGWWGALIGSGLPRCICCRTTGHIPCGTERGKERWMRSACTHGYRTSARLAGGDSWYIYGENSRCNATSIKSN